MEVIEELLNAKTFSCGNTARTVNVIVVFLTFAVFVVTF